MDENKYGFEPFEAAIALITTRYISAHVTKAELGEIINPKVIALKDRMPIHTEIFRIALQSPNFCRRRMSRSGIAWSCIGAWWKQVSLQRMSGI